VVRILDNHQVKRPAGIVLSPDETKLYIVDAHPSSPRLLAFALRRDGTVIEVPHVIYDFVKGKGGNGLCIDHHGE